MTLDELLTTLETALAAVETYTAEQDENADEGNAGNLEQVKLHLENALTTAEDLVP